MKMLTALISIYLFVPAFSFANAKVIGNGGFVLSCPNRTQIFDHYEIQKKSYIIQPLPGKSLNAKVEYLLSRLESIDPNRAKSYRFQYRKYWLDYQQQLNVEGLHLNYQDTQKPEYQQQFGLGAVSIPENCELVLALQQFPPSYSDHSRTPIAVQIYTPVWNRLDLDTQAALVLHELFYREYLLRTDVKTSTEVRYLNGLLGSKEFLSFHSKTWVAKLIEAGLTAMFPDFSIGTKGDAIDMEAQEDSENYQFWAWGSTPKLQGSVVLDNNILDITSVTYIFWQGLYPQKFSLNNPTVVDLSSYAHVTLKLNIDQSCIFKVDQKLDLKSIDHPRWWGGCNSFIESYGNKRLNIKGPVRAVYSRTGWTGHDALDDILPPPSTLHIEKTEFSILQVLIDGQWKDVDRVEVDLKTSKLLNYRLI